MRNTRTLYMPKVGVGLQMTLLPIKNLLMLEAKQLTLKVLSYFPEKMLYLFCYVKLLFSCLLILVERVDIVLYICYYTCGKIVPYTLSKETTDKPLNFQAYVKN